MGCCYYNNNVKSLGTGKVSYNDKYDKIVFNMKLIKKFTKIVAYNKLNLHKFKRNGII